MRKLRHRGFPEVTELSHGTAKCHTPVGGLPNVYSLFICFFFVLFVVYWNRLLLLPGWPRTLDPPALASRMLGLHICATFPAPPLVAIIPIPTIYHLSLWSMSSLPLTAPWAFYYLEQKGLCSPQRFPDVQNNGVPGKVLGEQTVY